jgi:hypothetical protein
VADRTHKPDGFLLHGYVSAAPASNGTPCTASARDIYAGAEVKITDDRGKALATGALGDGVLAGARCNFPFEISNVPGASTSVVVLVGAQPAAPFATSELREGRPAVVDASPTASRSPS